MRFHLVHVVLHKRLHGPQGYKEVVDTFEWGLTQLGHAVSRVQVQPRDLDGIFSPGACHIVFGVNMLRQETVEQLPDDTIVYNMEPVRGVSAANLTPGGLASAKRLQIWDYSDTSLPTWAKIGAPHPAKYVKVGYAPILERIGKGDEPIDVLFYGAARDVRLKVFSGIAQSGLSCAFASGLYGADRDALISKSKVVLNIGLSYANVFEIVRVSYLLANRKACAALLGADTVIDPDLRGAFKASPPQQFVDDVYALVEDETGRHALEDAAYEAMRRRDIRGILEEALG